jgi:hypothetical protein
MLENAQNTLSYEWNHLETELRESESVWLDSRRGDFETKHWDTIAEVVPDYLEALLDLAVAIQRVDEFLRFHNL